MQWSLHWISTQRIEIERSGALAPDAATEAADQLAAAKAHYLAKRYTDTLAPLNAIAELAASETAGTAEARAELAAQARALREWMQQANRPA